MSHPAFSTRKTNSIPVHLVDSRDFKSGKASLPGFAIDWAKRTGFAGKKGTLCLVPDGSAGGNGIACALLASAMIRALWMPVACRACCPKATGILLMQHLMRPCRASDGSGRLSLRPLPKGSAVAGASCPGR
ncbi:MAG: hypothetical protein R3D29_01540 [Nitratireductor sp.]